MRMLVTTFIFYLCSALPLAAQELTPRIYWPAPKGTRILVTGYSYSEGDVIFDPSIPIKGADSKINTGVLAYVQTLGLWGRASNLSWSYPTHGARQKVFWTIIR